MALCMFKSCLNRPMKTNFILLLVLSAMVTFIYLLYVQRNVKTLKSVPQSFHQRMEHDEVEMLEYTGPYDGPLNPRQQQVVKEIQHIWKSYRKYAYGHDQLNTHQKSYSEWFNASLTLIDSLDTLFICGMKEEFEEARVWIRDNLTFSHSKITSFFEIVIRDLAGLLSAYHLSNDRMFLEKAALLSSKLDGCLFNHPIPCSNVYEDIYDDTFSSGPAIAGSWSLEFLDLARSLNNITVEDKVHSVYANLKSITSNNGLLADDIQIKGNSLQGSYGSYAMGGNHDSYYEYLLKTWLLLDKDEKYDSYKNSYLTAMAGLGKLLLKKTSTGIPIVAKMDNSMQMEHLTCFLPGSLALAHMSDLTLQVGDRDLLTLAGDLMNSCYMMTNTETGLAGELTLFTGNTTEPLNRSYILRPEIVESLYYMYKATRDRRYQEMGWTMFQAIRKYTRVENGYSEYKDVSNINKPSNVMGELPSYFISETLKYFYLLFSDDQNLLPLNEWVFNTEGHPLPIRT